MLWMGSQELTHRLDTRGKYTSLRTYDLAFLTQARRLKSFAIYLPESSKPYMRRKHEPRHIIDFMANETYSQPNYRRFRSLRNLQGADYVYTLRGMREVTLWDWDKWDQHKEIAPVRDWTVVRDVNDVVRREKSVRAAHFSELRYLAPLADGCRPSRNLAQRLEETLNPETPNLGLLSPPPDGEILYPQPQAAVNQVADSDDDSDDGSDDDSGSNGSDEPDDNMGDDTDDDGGDGGNGAAGANPSHPNYGDDEHGHRPHDDAQDLVLLQAALDDALPGYTSDEGSDQEQKPNPDAAAEVWADNGQIIDLMSDHEDNNGLQHERDRSRSLFVRSPTRVQQGEFVTKIETASPPRKTPSAVPNRVRSISSTIHGGITPVRETRADSSMFLSPTPYNALNPQAGDRTSPIDLTEQMGLSVSSPAPPSHSDSIRQGSGRNKRERSFASWDDDEENDSDDENEDVRFMGSSPKRPRLFDGDDEDEDIQLMRGPPKRPRLPDDDGGAEMIMEEELELA
ncbi:hypothetical protein IL306_013880 [Fusarium sp. DS 682]|nr:hypothetical protein IL306_013880 [Fusarium sp. DS 682]